MRLGRRNIGFALAAVVLATLFVRLAVWQLDRHRERAAQNALRAERIARPPLEISSGDLVGLPPLDSLAWRRVRPHGRWDFEHEILISPRSHGGRPAVELLTPLRLSDGTALLVLRGWVPAPDGLHGPIRRARPAERSARPEAVVMPSPRSGRASPTKPRPTATRTVVDGDSHLVLRAPDLEIASNILPYPIVQFYVMAIDTDSGRSEIYPFPSPDPGRGPHLGYAIQWFAFALIALGGTAALLKKSA